MIRQVFHTAQRILARASFTMAAVRARTEAFDSSLFVPKAEKLTTNGLRIAKINVETLTRPLLLTLIEVGTCAPFQAFCAGPILGTNSTNDAPSSNAKFLL